MRELARDCQTRQLTIARRARKQNIFREVGINRTTAKKGESAVSAVSALITPVLPGSRIPCTSYQTQSVEYSACSRPGNLRHSSGGVLRVRPPWSCSTRRIQRIESQIPFLDFRGAERKHFHVLTDCRSARWASPYNSPVSFHSWRLYGFTAAVSCSERHSGDTHRNIQSSVVICNTY